MPSFKDTSDREWIIRFDGLLLDDLRNERGINLADISGADYLRIETDAGALTKAVCFLIADQFKTAVPAITEKQFAASFTGEVHEAAIAAIWSAAKVFFPPKKWSALQSSCSTRKQFQQQWEEMRPMLARLNQPDMPQALQDGIMEALKEAFQGMSHSDLRTFADQASATGQEVSQLKSALNLPDSAVSAPAA